jgi:hypothetical protein
MSSLIVAKFDTQFAAAAAFDRLMSRGLQRGHGVVQCDESVGHSASSASAPTTVVSRVSHRGERQGEKRVMRAPDTLPPPMQLGFATLSVQIDDDASIEEVMGVMRGLDAVDVHILPGELLHEVDASSWPEQGMGSRADVERAIRAARQGKPPCTDPGP